MGINDLRPYRIIHIPKDENGKTSSLTRGASRAKKRNNMNNNNKHKTKMPSSQVAKAPVQNFCIDILVIAIDMNLHK